MTSIFYLQVLGGAGILAARAASWAAVSRRPAARPRRSLLTPGAARGGGALALAGRLLCGLRRGPGRWAAAAQPPPPAPFTPRRRPRKLGWRGVLAQRRGHGVGSASRRPPPALPPRHRPPLRLVARLRGGGMGRAAARPGRRAVWAGRSRRPGAPSPPPYSPHHLCQCWL
jgi:hypothetical protein